MLGNNSMLLNDATMIAAVEYYLNNVVCKIPVKVINVTKHTDGFSVQLTQPKDTDKAKSDDK